MVIRYKLKNGKDPGRPSMKCPCWRVGKTNLSVDAGQNPVILLRSRDGAFGGLLSVADTGYHFTGLATDQLRQALERFEAQGHSNNNIDAAIIGGSDGAKWKIPKLSNILKKLGLIPKEHDINGMFYRNIYFNPATGEAEAYRLAANPDHWNPAKANLSLDDGTRAFSDGQSGGVVVNATRFFRDPNPFNALEKIIIPAHLENSPRMPLHIWSSACSNGAETYSLAMFIDRKLKEMKARTPFTVFGTDINPHMIETAKSGIYQLIRSDLSKYRGYFEEYGEIDGTDFSFGPGIREHVSFRVFDLKNRPRKYRFHLIVCANVFQYYSDEARRFFVENFIAVSKAPGYIYVGHVNDHIIEGLEVSKIPEYKLLAVK